MSLTTFKRTDVHFLLVLVASSAVFLACLYLIIWVYTKRQYKGKLREIQRPFIKGKRNSRSPRRSPLLFGSLQFTDGQSRSPKTQRHSPLPSKLTSPVIINNKTSVPRNLLCDVSTSVNRPCSQRYPLPEMKKTTPPQKKTEPKVIFKMNHPQVPSKDSNDCDPGPEDMAEARIILDRDHEGDISNKDEVKAASSEVTTDISVPKESESNTSDKQLSQVASDKHGMRPRAYQITRDQSRSPISYPAGRGHVTSHQREPLWSHCCHSENTIGKVDTGKHHKTPISIRTDTAKKFDLSNSQSSLLHSPNGVKYDPSVTSMNSLKMMRTYSSSNSESIKGVSNILDNSSDTCSLHVDNIRMESTSKSQSRWKKDRKNSRSSESVSNCSHGASDVNNIVANASKTEVVCAQCGITLPKPQCFYSLGSLCTDGEFCETDSDDINRHPIGDIDDDPPPVDVQSHHDTGYTSSEDFEEESTFSKGLEPVLSHDKRETDSYDGDYETDSEETALKHDNLSDDKALKPLVSVGEPVPIKDYALREWKSGTPTSRAMKKGYGCISSQTGCDHLRQIRGDNYCAIRAVLFQVLAGKLPVLNLFASDEKSKLKKISTTHAFLDQWSFANRLPVPKKEIRTTLDNFLLFFSSQIRRICKIPSQPERIDSTLSLLNNETEEFKILEATKLLMYDAAVHLYTKLSRGEDVPVFAMLLFARDSSESPRGLLTNHLNRTGDTGGLEQVEMCLLGYTLGVVIQVIRPSQVDKEDFIAHYPSLDDAPNYTPTVTLVAEDDRHYNIVM